MEVLKYDNYRLHLKFNPREDNIRRKIDGIQSNKNDFNVWVPITLSKLEQISEFYPDNEIINDIKNDLEASNLSEELNIYDIHSDKLRDYQNLVVEQIKEKGSYGLFMEQRLGKTPTTVIALENAPKVVISVPNGLQVSWYNAFLHFTKRNDVKTVIKCSPAKREKIYKEFKESDSQVLIISTDTLARDSKAHYAKDKVTVTKKQLFSAKHDYLVVDEAHFLRNDKTIKSKGIIGLRKYAKHALALTGTPATNHAKDVIPILQFITNGGFTKWGLIDYFFNTADGQFAKEIFDIKSSRVVEWTQLLNRFSILMKQKDYMHWIPSIVHEKLELELNDKQLSIFNDMKNDMKVNKTTGDVYRAPIIVNQMQKLIEIGLDPRIVDVDVKGVKTEWLIDYLDACKDEPIIIWTTSNKYIQILKKELAEHNPLVLDGSVSAKNRKQIEDDFNGGKSNVLIAMISVGKEGYTLDRATKMIFMDKEWSLINNQQAYARFIPTTKEKSGDKSIIIISVVVKDSMDEQIEIANENKLNRTEIVNNYLSWLG